MLGRINEKRTSVRRDKAAKIIVKNTSNVIIIIIIILPNIATDSLHYGKVRIIITVEPL